MLLNKAKQLHQFKQIKYDKLKMVVVDSADFFCEKEDDRATMRKVYEQISKETPNCQKLFFSATYPTYIIDFLKELIPENAIKIELP